MNKKEKETAIQNEQQFKTQKEIINEILDVLFQNEGMSFYWGKEILIEAIDVLSKTPIKLN